MDLAFLLVFGALWTKVLSEELYVTTPTSVLHIDTSTSQTSTIVTKENGRLLGLAADWRGERLYYTDVSPTGGGIYTANLQGGDVRKLPIQYPGMEPVGLAIDWVYGHLYWTDTVYRAVMMSNLDGTGRVTIVTENLIIPRGIAVDPKRRELYVGDQGKHAVQVCGLDGRNCRELNVTDDSATFWPNQIAIDYASKKVHWTDGWVPALYSCSVGGTGCQRKTGNLSTELGSNPAFGLAVGQSGQLYLSTLHNQSLYRSSLDLELTSVQIASSETKMLFLLRKETGSNQPTVVTLNPCAINKGGCSDICLPHSGDSFTCMCPDASGKLPVNKICQHPNQFLLFTDISKGIVGLANVDDSEMQTTIMRAVKPLAVTYHQTEKKVYFADARLRTIYKCNIDGSDVETVLNSSHGIGQVEGLSVDYRQNRLYFSNMGFEEYDGVLRSWHTIEMVDLDTKQRRTIVTSLEKPRAVVVDSKRRVLYYTDWGSAGHVGRVALDGSNRVVLTTAENPNDLIISDNKLLIINNKQPTAEIIEIDLANSNSAISRRQLSNVEPLSLAVSGDNLLVSSFTGVLNIYSKSSLGQTFSSSFGHFTRMIVVDTTDTIKRDEGVCSASGSCSDICVTSSQSDFFTCLCPTNTFNELTADRLSCQDPNSYILFADIDGIKMVPRGNTGDNHVYTIVYPSADCSHFYGLVVDENQHYIYFSALQGNSIFRASVDGSNVQKFVTDANGKITSLALSRSDLFWTSTNTNDNSTGAIVHCNTEDTSRTVTILYNTTAEPLDIAADESNIYWTERGRSGVKLFDRRESTARSSIDDVVQTSAIALTVPSRHLLYATDSSVIIRRFPTNSFTSSLMDTIAESGVRTLMATRQFLYLSRWWGNSTGSVTRHDLATTRSFDVTSAAVRPGQMVFISNQKPNVQDKVGTCPSIGSCSSTACFLDVDCYGSSKCCGTSQCTRCSTPEQGSDCIKDGVFIENSGGAVDFGCEKCSCLNGSLTCVPLACPDLGSCPTENKIQPYGSCCPLCSAITVCSSPPTIENCPTSTKSLRLSTNSDTVNVTLDDVIFATTYGKSCSGQKLNLDFTDGSIRYRPYLQTVTVSASDKHGTATCKISVNVLDDTKPVFDSCPSGVLQMYVTQSSRVVTWSPVTARDNSGDVTVTADTQNGIERPPGLYDVHYEALDGSGNSEDCTFSINVTMLQACKSPPIPFNGLLSCKDASQLTCQLEQCNTGYLNTLSVTQTHTCDQSSGQWVPPFPSNFTNVCSKPEPLIIQREYIFEFNCPNSKFDALDLQKCVSNARLCPRDDIKLCDRPFKQIGSSVASSSRIVMWMEGILPYGGDMVGLTTRMNNTGEMIKDFFQTGDFKTKCPRISCAFSKATSEPDTKKCEVGSKTFLVAGKEICAPCPAGWFYANGDCSECPANTYQERTGQTMCMPCPERSFSSIGSFLQSHCNINNSLVATEQTGTFVIRIVAVAVGILIVILAAVSIVCFVRRKRVSQKYPSGGNFENPVFMGHGNGAFAGPSVDEYDQITAYKMQPVPQAQNFKNKGGDGYYESKATTPTEDHSYRGLEAASSGASNKAIQEADYSHFDDFDSPNERLLADNDVKKDNVYSIVQRS